MGTEDQTPVEPTYDPAREERLKDREVSQIAKEPTDPATTGARAEAKAVTNDDDWEGMTVEETADLNKDAVEANKQTEDDIKRVGTPDIPPPPFIDPTSVSPVDPNSDPGGRRAARDAEGEQTLRTGPLDVHGNVVPEEPVDDDDDDDDDNEEFRR